MVAPDGDGFVGWNDVGRSGNDDVKLFAGAAQRVDDEGRGLAHAGVVQPLTTGCHLFAEVRVSNLVDSKR